MTFALVLIGLGVADTVRWTVGPVGLRRAVAATGAGALAVALVVAGSGGTMISVASSLVVAAVVVGAWVFLSQGDRVHPAWPVSLVIALLFTGFVTTGLWSMNGVLQHWYAASTDLRDVSPTSMAVAIGGVLFLLGSANRFVRLVLSGAGPLIEPGEATLKGGRVLGPLERLFIFALALRGDLAAAAVVVAAKGLLRFPELRRAEEDRQREASDLVTEYFLVGTLTSWLVAVMLALGTSALA